MRSGASASHIGAMHQPPGERSGAAASASAAGSKYMARKWLRKPMKMTISSPAISNAAQAKER